MEKKTNIGRYLGDLSLMHGYPGNLVTLVMLQDLSCFDERGG